METQLAHGTADATRGDLLSKLEGEATASKIPSMIADIGIEDQIIANAVTVFAIQHINECPGISVCDLQGGCSYYAAGYGDCLKLIRPI